MVLQCCVQVALVYLTKATKYKNVDAGNSDRPQRCSKGLPSDEKVKVKEDIERKEGGRIRER